MQAKRQAMRGSAPGVGALALAVLPLAWSSQPEAWLFWLALFGPAAGALCAFEPAGAEPRRWPTSLVWFVGVTLGWCALWAWVSKDSVSPAHRVAGCGASAGLLALGWGGVGLVRRFGCGAGGAGVLGALALSALLTALPTAFWLPDGPHGSPEAHAIALSWSPASLALESAGVDLMRTPPFYEPAGTDRMGPDLRIAWGNLAGWGALVVGWLAAGASLLRWRRSSPHP